MTTYYEYNSPNGDVQMDPAGTTHGWMAFLTWIDPTVEDILTRNGGDPYGIPLNWSVASGHYEQERVVITTAQAATHQDAVDFAVAYAKTATPPQPGWLVWAVQVNFLNYLATTQIGEIP